MQHGSLIRSGRKRAPDVWQFRWSDRGPSGKRIYRRRVIGTICEYPDPDSEGKVVTGLLREVNTKAPSGFAQQQMTIADLCDHFAQRELTKDNTW